MHNLISSFLLFGFACSFVSAVPTPQWLYEEIHALPDSDTTELHTKKSNIPDDISHVLPHKRKDGVKKLFNFLDSAIQQSGSGSGDGSGQEQVTMATEQHSSSTGLTEKQSVAVASSKQQEKTSSRDPAPLESKARGAVVDGGDQVPSNTNKAGLTSYSRQGSTGLPASSNPQSTQAFYQHATADHQGGQRVAVTVPQRTTGNMASTNPQSLTYSTNTSPYARSMQGQKTTNSYSVAGQRAQSYGYTASRRRPPAIPVRSQVATGRALRPPPLITARRPLAASPQRSSIQGPFYTTMTVIGPNQYGGYFVDAHGFPVANGKSAEPLQGKAYGQPKRQRDQFHQQTRALIPGTPVAQPYNRYPYPRTVSFPGQVRAAIQPHFPYQRPNRVVVSRARMPTFKGLVTSPPNPASLPGQVYYRNAIPQQQASFVRLAHGQMRSYGYPLIKRVGRAVFNRKPQPRTLMTSLTAAAARLVVPARPEAYDNLATAESVWSAAAPQKAAHAVRSNTHPGKA